MAAKDAEAMVTMLRGGRCKAGSVDCDDTVRSSYGYGGVCTEEKEKMITKNNAIAKKMRTTMPMRVGVLCFCCCVYLSAMWISVGIPIAYAQVVEMPSPRISAMEWAMLLGTRWTQWAPITGLTSQSWASMLVDELNQQVYVSSDTAENNLQQGQKTTFLARYPDILADFAYFLAYNPTRVGGAVNAGLAEGPGAAGTVAAAGGGGGEGGGTMANVAVTPVSGCCNGDNVKTPNYSHFFIYTTLDVVNILRNYTAYFVRVEALPPIAKVEPALLGRAMDGSSLQNLLTDPFSLKVILAPGAADSIQTADQIASDMAKLVPSKPLLSRALSPEVILLGSVTQIILLTVVQAISLRPEVLRIIPLLGYSKHDAWAYKVIQSPVSLTPTPLFDNNLTGINQVIGLTDTGIDMNHCFFSSNSSNVGTPTDQFNPSQRKVLKYASVADGNDTFVERGGGHGTFVAGIIAGSPPLSSGISTTEQSMALAHSGVARDAKLVFYDIGDVSDALSGLELKTLKEILLDSIRNNASVHAVPFGIQSKNFSTQLYDLDSRDVDDVSFNHENFLVVVSVGNDGANGLYTLTSPAVSKNAIAVGASLNAAEALQTCATYCAPVFCSCPPNITVGDLDPLYLAPFSSKGPTIDARIKPDVVAPGMHVWSASSTSGGASCRLTPSQGTSAAAGVVAGVAALVRQYFTEGRYPIGMVDIMRGFVPSGALIKACIIHGARGLIGYVNERTGFSFIEFSPTTSFPNQFEGFGLVRVDRALFFPSLTQSVDSNNGPRNLFVKSGTIDNATLFGGESHTYSIELISSLSPFRATLVWMDPPGFIGALTPVLHDLDLSVQDPNGHVLHPNGLSAPDRLNNVERITVVAPTRGIHLVTVSAVTVRPLNPQPYALVVTGHFDWSSIQPPVAGQVARQPRPLATCFISGSLRNAAECPALAGDTSSDTTLPVYDLSSPVSPVTINATEASMDINGIALFGDVQIQTATAGIERTFLRPDEALNITTGAEKLAGGFPVDSGARSSATLPPSILAVAFMMTIFIAV